jgi:hypothetical protein
MESDFFKKYQSILISVGIFAFVGLTGLFFLWPKISEILEMRSSLDTEKATLAQLTSKLALLQSLDAGELENKNKILLTLLPVEKDPTNSFMTIRGLTAEASLDGVVLNVSPGLVSTNSASKSAAPVVAQTENNPYLEYTFQAEGDKLKFSGFLSKLEKIMPLMQISDLKFSTIEVKPTIKLTIRSYYFPLPKSLGKVETPITTLGTQEEDTYRTASTYLLPEAAPSFTPVQTGKVNPFQY